MTPESHDAERAKLRSPRPRVSTLKARMNSNSTEFASTEIPAAVGSGLRYVLITPARNEAASIEQTIQAMAAQSVRPLRWVIVSDGSTDGTDEIVGRYSAQFDWLKLVRMPERRERHFAGKVHAFNAGYAQVTDLDYDVIGNLDADITMDVTYFDFLLKKFAENPQLGVAGTPFREGATQYDYRFTSVEHVSGACQLFRRKCFEQIGGYTPREIGGIDLVAVLTARFKGWQTRSFLERTCVHHRPMGTASQPGLMVRLKGGRGDYLLGSHPMWEVSRCLYQMTRRPVLLGGGMRLVGYFWAMLSRAERQVPAELIRFRRKEQMHRIGDFLKRVATLKFSHPETQ
ncbi:MAG: glycosyltransferase [Candidatus Binatia bacterium]